MRGLLGMLGLGPSRARRSGIELTLAAALRDLDNPRPEVRGVAIRNLAPALLDELGLRPPSWWEQIDHPERDRAGAALEAACADPAPQNAALACIGLAQLAAPNSLERALESIATPGSDDAAMFSRECGVIALALLGAAARSFLDQPDSAADGETRARALDQRDRCLSELRALLDDERDDVRFQLGPALVEVGGASVEPELLAAFEREQQPEVRENLISAIALLDRPSPGSCDALAQVLAGETNPTSWLAWEAALALTGARRPEGAARLIVALNSRETRDQALEALAVLGERAGADAAAAIVPLTRGLMIPVFTRVRAAYALARVAPQDGRPRLDQFAKHPRSAVREAVAEARQHLADLDAEDRSTTDHDVYRRGQS